jgi:hypothetical protein
MVEFCKIECILDDLAIHKYEYSEATYKGRGGEIRERHFCEWNRDGI